MNDEKEMIMIPVKVITNHVPRDVIDGAELTDTERAEFTYIDWSGVDEGTASASFVRYWGDLHDLCEFTVDLPASLATAWDGIKVDSFFSGLLVKFVDDNERVIVGRVLT